MASQRRIMDVKRSRNRFRACHELRQRRGVFNQRNDERAAHIMMCLLWSVFVMKTYARRGEELLDFNLSLWR